MDENIEGLKAAQDLLLERARQADELMRERDEKARLLESMTRERDSYKKGLEDVYAKYHDKWCGTESDRGDLCLCLERAIDQAKAFPGVVLQLSETKAKLGRAYDCLESMWQAKTLLEAHQAFVAWRDTPDTEKRKEPCDHENACKNVCRKCGEIYP